MTRPQGTVFVVDDDKIILESLTEFLRLEGFDVLGGSCFEDAAKALSAKRYDVVITDINMPGADGFELLRFVKQRYPETAVIIITGYGTIESAVEAIKMGAYDYLTKPIIDEEIRLVVQRAIEQCALKRECRNLREQLGERYSLDSIIGHHYTMLRIFDLIQAVCESKVTVLVEGPSGTGKSLVARIIHHRSDRSDKPFVEVSCGALPESLLESELFGHVRGAFTGAVADKEGKFSAADGGTLFLDEISSASPALQVKLLRVLQEREFEPVGSNKTEKVDVRLIVATNVDLEEEVAAARFRQDLYYRINVVTIAMPPLHERLGDIPLLADSFLQKYAAQADKRVIDFTDDAMRCLQRHRWPGNVRELENVVERAVVLATGRRIGIDDLPEKIAHASTLPPAPDEYVPASLREALEGPERRVIEAALRHNNWSRRQTADQLEINRTTLYKKMKRYGLDVEPAGRVVRS